MSARYICDGCGRDLLGPPITLAIGKQEFHICNDNLLASEQAYCIERLGVECGEQIKTAVLEELRRLAREQRRATQLDEADKPERRRRWA